VELGVAPASDEKASRSFRTIMTRRIQKAKQAALK